MAVKECSLYRFKIGNQIKDTTPADRTARKAASRKQGIVNHGTTTTVKLDFPAGVTYRVLLLGHGQNSTLRGIYILPYNTSSASTVIASTDVAVSFATDTVTITNNHASGNCRYVII